MGDKWEYGGEGGGGESGYNQPKDQGETEAAAGYSETGGVLTSEAAQQGI